MGRIAALVLLAAVAAPTSARANGYGEAKGLVLAAEELFARGDDAGALQKLDAALALQTTVDRKRQEYGYAAYVHLRRARHWLAKGKRAQALAEARKALRVSAGSDYVDEEFLVGPHHPFIRASFPELGGFPTKTTAPHEIAPDALMVTGRGPFALIAGGRRVYRLERASRRLSELHSLAGDSLYRLAAHPDGNQLAFAYERAAFIYHLIVEPYALRRIARPSLPDGLYWDAAGTRLVSFTSGEVHAAALGPQAAFGSQGRIDGKWLTTSGHGGLYLRALPGASCSHYGCDADAVMAHRVEDGARTFVFALRDPDENRFLRVGASADPDYAVIVRDAAGDGRVMVHRFSTGESFAVSLPVPATLGRWDTGRQVLLTPKADALVYVCATSQGPELLRVGLDGTLLQRVALAGMAALDRWTLHGLEVTSDGGTVLVHVGDSVWVVRGERVTSVDLRPFSRKPNPEWAGSSTLFADPDELFVGIERGGSRYFMAVGLHELLR